MHELGIMSEVVKIVERSMAANNMKKVEKVVLQVGELAEIVPEYLESCYDATTFKTSLEGSKLEIEIIPGIGWCNNCNEEFNIVKNEGKCPHCQFTEYEIVSGQEFLVKQIMAR